MIKVELGLGLCLGLWVTVRVVFGVVLGLWLVLGFRCWLGLG